MLMPPSVNYELVVLGGIEAMNPENINCLLEALCDNAVSQSDQD